MNSHDYSCDLLWPWVDRTPIWVLGYRTRLLKRSEIISKRILAPNPRLCISTTHQYTPIIISSIKYLINGVAYD